VVHLQDIVVHERMIFSDCTVLARILTPAALKKKAAPSQESAALWVGRNGEAKLFLQGQDQQPT
jgi:hypothetical protein